MEQSDFHVQTKEFSGPLELLLELVEKRKMDISAISLASVTDEYVAFVRGGVGIPLAQTAQFLLVASTLLLIKSRALVPSILLSQEEEGDIDELERRLRAYAYIREQSRALDKRWNTQYLFSPSPRVRVKMPVTFAPGNDATVVGLHTAARELVRTLPVFSKNQEVKVQKEISLDEMIARVNKRITEHSTVLFSALYAKSSRNDSVVGFLAVLELVKQGIVHTQQKTVFDDIVIEKIV